MRDYFNYQIVEPYLFETIKSLGYKPNRIIWGRTTSLDFLDGDVNKNCLIRLGKSFAGNPPWWQPPTPEQSKSYDFMLFVNVKNSNVTSSNDVSIYIRPIATFDNTTKIHLADLEAYELAHRITPQQQAKNFIKELDEKYSGKPEFVEVVVKQITRPSELRNAILVERGTKCQICEYVGFQKRDGGIYAETHHMIELNNNAPNTLQSWNILVLCPLCHKKMHYANVDSKFLGNGWEIVIDNKKHIIR